MRQDTYISSQVSLYFRPGYRIVHGPERDLYFAEGVWYRQVEPGRYVVVAPAIGVTVPVLPPSHATVRVRGVPYYYANNIYYLRSPTGYLVVDPPAERIGSAGGTPRFRDRTAAKLTVNAVQEICNEINADEFHRTADYGCGRARV